jgi:replicative DNA helicase
VTHSHTTAPGDPSADEPNPDPGPAAGHPTRPPIGRAGDRPARGPHPVGGLTAEGILDQLRAAHVLHALHGDAPAGSARLRPAQPATAGPTGRSEGDEPTAVAPAAWDGDPVPLTARRLLPPFPLDALPGWVADQVAAVTDALQTPLDLAGCLALACLATAAGGRVQAQVRPGWVEPTNLFTVVALPPGARKTPVFRAMTAPLLAAEAHLQETATPARVEAELALRLARARAERTAKAAEHALSSDAQAEALAEASDAALTAERITVPVPPRLVADDVTPETAASLLAEQGGRLGVLSAEGGIFATIAGRYSGQPNFEVFLKGHAGDLLRVDRKTREPEHIEAPALTLGLCVQPEVLRDIAAVPGFRGRGLLARILYSLPANTVGHRQPRDAKPVPDPVATAYSDQLSALICSLTRPGGSSTGGGEQLTTLDLTPDADAAVLTLEEAIEPRLAADGGDLAHIVDWAAKLVGATVRIAALIHLADHLRTGWGEPIQAATIDRATQLGHYYLAHALAVFDHMGADPVVEDARTVLSWITRTRIDQFSRRDLFTAIRSTRIAKVGDLDPALNLLTQHGHIRPVPVTPSGHAGGRPPSPRFEVHPAVHAHPYAEPAQPAQRQRPIGSAGSASSALRHAPRRHYPTDEPPPAATATPPGVHTERAQPAQPHPGASSAGSASSAATEPTRTQPR